MKWHSSRCALLLVHDDEFKRLQSRDAGRRLWLHSPAFGSSERTCTHRHLPLEQGSGRRSEASCWLHALAHGCSVWYAPSLICSHNLTHGRDYTDKTNVALTLIDNGANVNAKDNEGNTALGALCTFNGFMITAS